MQTLDVVNAHGLKPANFLDIGGGAQASQVTRALSMVLSDPNVKAVICNIFGGITRGDEVARGMLAATEQMDIPVPVVVRLSGTQEEAGRALLAGSRFIPVANVQEAAQRVKELTEV
jgi:succinyl-CoA synthetase beta subunit